MQHGSDLNIQTANNPFAQSFLGDQEFWTGQVYFRPPGRSDQAISEIPRDVKGVVQNVMENYLTHTYEGIYLIDILKAIESAIQRKTFEGEKNPVFKFFDSFKYTMEHIFYDPLGVLTTDVIREIYIQRGLLHKDMSMMQEVMAEVIDDESNTGPSSLNINVNRMKDAMADLVDMGLVTKPDYPGTFSLLKTSHLTDAGRILLEKYRKREYVVNSSIISYLKTPNTDLSHTNLRQRELEYAVN